MSSQAPVFRYDINGLRAYVVLAVLLFHFNLFGLNAGFIGVDLFFVISGYLMTSIVVRGLEKNNFSFGNFYLSRLRRIVPALLVLISVFTIFAWFYLTTPALKKFSKEAFSAALKLAERIGVAAAARELKVYESQLYSWRTAAQKKSSTSAREAEQAAEIVS